jgi:hypothetical protein
VRAPESEVVRPSVATRMKQRRHLVGQSVDPTQVGTFVKVAAMARQREIIGVIETAMLLSNDVLNVMDQFTEPLVKPAILATLASPFTDEPPRSGIHCY